MNQINATIKLNPARLNFPCGTIYARQLHSFAVRFEGIPADVATPTVRIFKTNLTEYFDIPFGFDESGVGEVLIIGTCFPNVGASKYEIHAVDRNGNPTALGCGAISIEAFSASAAPITPDVPVVVTEVPDASGVMHTINAMPDGTGNYTLVVN